MGFIINEKEFINGNIFNFEKALQSQYTIFSDKNPTFVTYYHINNINSTTDSGLLNIEQIIGNNSPLKFQKIENFPIYGIEQIQLDLSDEEEGLTTNFDGDGIILPNTIKPLPNDFFIIPYLKTDCLFMVNQISYDTIKSNSFYKIQYNMRTLDSETVSDIESQVLQKYTCVFKNIGTQDNCLIEEDAYKYVKELENVYSDISKKYLNLYYSEKYNAVTYNNFEYKIYDDFLTNFINKNRLFNANEKYKTIYLNLEDYGDHFPVIYDNCIYSIIENNTMKDLEYIRYELRPITYMHSIFLYYGKNDFKSVKFYDKGKETYLSDNLIDAIKGNIIENSNNIIEELLIKYFNNSIESVFQINIDKLKNYKFKYSFNEYIMIPILLFILKHYIKNIFLID